MTEGCSICGQTRSSEHHLSMCQQQCLSITICKPPKTNCFFPNCSECPRPTDLQTALENVFTDNANENIIFKQWILAYRCELITTVKSTKNSCNHWWKNCHFYFIIHSFQHRKLRPSKNRNAIWNHKNLWFCETPIKIILSFCKMKHKGLTGRMHKPPSSICNLSQETGSLKYREWESSNGIWLFEAWISFGTYLPVVSEEVYWKHIWITFKGNNKLLKDLTAYFPRPCTHACMRARARTHTHRVSKPLLLWSDWEKRSSGLSDNTDWQSKR
jgi:hypothetical protein